MNIETITTCITSLVGLAALIFGISKDDVATINAAVPSIVGGVTSLVSVIALLRHKRLARTTVFNAMVASSKPNGEVSAMSAGETVKNAAKATGLI